MKSNQKNKTAFAIVRISSRRQEDNTSHDVQEKEIRRYCDRQGLDLIRVERIIESAKDADLRKKYRAIFDAAIRSGITNAIYYRYDREARNLTDAERTEVLARTGVLRLHYICDQKVFDENTPDSEYLNRDIHAVLNKNYSRDLSTKVNTAMTAKAESGWFPSNHVPLGYATQKLKTQTGREAKRGAIVVPDPNAKNIQQVQREFKLRADGYSFEQIREQIIREGFILPDQIKSYGKSVIHARLNNKFYSGHFTWKGSEYRGNHELIIPADVLTKVQQSLGIRNQNRRSKGDFENGWIRCAEPACGCWVIFNPVTKKVKDSGQVKVHRYYHCTNGKRAHSSLKGMRIREDEIWRQMETPIESITITSEMAKDIADALNTTQEKTRAAIKKQMADYRAALAAVEQKRNKVFDLFADGQIDKTEHQRQSLRIREEEKHFTKLLEEAQISVSDAGMETAKSVLNLATDAKSLWKSKSQADRRSDLEKVLYNPVLDGLTVRYELRKPFDALRKINTSEKWWAHLDEFRTSCNEAAA